MTRRGSCMGQISGTIQDVGATHDTLVRSVAADSRRHLVEIMRLYDDTGHSSAAGDSSLRSLQARGNNEDGRSGG